MMNTQFLKCKKGAACDCLSWESVKSATDLILADSCFRRNDKGIWSDEGAWDDKRVSNDNRISNDHSLRHGNVLKNDIGMDIRNEGFVLSSRVTNNGNGLLKQYLKGFSLLEVMVALALLGLTFSGLILVQTRATNLAAQSKNISIATTLARLQLMECKREAQKIIASVSDFNEEGDYTDLGFPEFKWECHAPKFNMRSPSGSQIEETVKKNTKDADKQKAGSSTDISAPFVSMITNSLGDSVRELAVIIRWKDNEIDDEVRVVTHIVDLAAMHGLSRMLAQGLKTLESATDKKNNAKESPPPPPADRREPR